MRIAARIALTTVLFASSMSFADEYLTPQDHPDFAKPQFIGRPLDKAYPGLEYNIRPAIKGGRYPYAFALVEGPAGMTIDPHKGTVRWNAPEVEGKTFKVTIRLTDADGKTTSQSFEVLVSKKGFYFVGPRGHDATGDGSVEKPWRSIEKANRPSERFRYPSGAVVYVRGGEYRVNVAPEPGRRGLRGGNVVTIGRNSPRRWMAYPGEKPVIDFGWTRERHDKAHAEKKRTGAKQIDTGGYGCGFYIQGAADDFYFDGFEVRNNWDKTFKLVDGVEGATFRRCDMHDLYCEGANNPSFIFTASAKKRGPRRTWGERPDADWHRHLVIQDNHFHDRFRYEGFHGGAMVFYTVRDALVEDNRIEKISRGHAIADKDSGWGNTYRGNRMQGILGLLTQGFNEDIEICHNYIQGPVAVGGQRGWMRNIWIHHNTIEGNVKLFGGDSTVPEGLGDAGGDFSGPETADTRRLLKAAPKHKALVHFYRNVLTVPGGESGDANVILTIHDGRFFAERFRYLRWDENLIDAKGGVRVLWGKFRPWSLMTAPGFDAKSVVAQVKLDAEGNLPPGSPYRRLYGHEVPAK
ncbi:MAG: hypothetical protein AMS16_04715 [Planctomycetes bacterium DG_58]|nr:MAG: hypothetical protein AMS16_04715 [Planctomycetes bacterium DG_58]